MESFNFEEFIKEGALLYKEVDEYLEEMYISEKLFKSKKERDAESPKKERRPSLAKDALDLTKGVGRVASWVGRGLIDTLAGRKRKIKALLRKAKKDGADKAKILALKKELKNVSNRELRLANKDRKSELKDKKDNRNIAKARLQRMKSRVKEDYNFFVTYEEIIDEGLLSTALKYGLWANSFMSNLAGVPSLFSLEFFKKAFNDIQPQIIDSVHNAWRDILDKKKAISYFISQARDPEIIKLAQEVLDSYDHREKQIKTIEQNKDLPSVSREKALKGLVRKVTDLEKIYDKIGIPNHMK